MKAGRILQVISFFLLSLISCTKKEPLGKCSNPVVFSSETIQFSVSENLVEVTADRSDWWIAGIVWNGARVDSIIDFGSSNLKVELGNFVVERIDGDRLMIKCAQNNTGKENTLWIETQSGNCIKSIKVIQSAH